MEEVMDVSSPAGKRGEVDLARWLGRRDAFGMVAGRCSAADVECIRQIRDEQLYKGSANDWAEFCDKELHMSKTNANRLISQLEQFGPEYFHIAQITRISVAGYRAIAPAVSPEGIECNGELIPFHEGNSERIAAAVSTLSAANRAKPERDFQARVAALESAADRLLEKLRDLRQECGKADPYLTSLAVSLHEKAIRVAQEIG